MKENAATQTTIYQCSNPNCCLRFPSARPLKVDPLCPSCKSPTHRVPLPPEIEASSQRNPNRAGVNLEVLLDNIRSTFNVGAMFRTADGAGVRHLHLCGITPLPENPKVAKTALGAELAVPWSYSPNGLLLAGELKRQGKKLLALEVAQGAVPLLELPPSALGEAAVLVVGNEVTGVDPEIRALCDQTIYIPMVGYKRSLNVAIAYGIAVYFLSYYPQIQTRPIDPIRRNG